jgi:putative transposase
VKHLYSYKYRLTPTPDQEVLLTKHFGCTRFIYNHFLGQRISTYKTTKRGSTYVNDANELPELKSKFEWLKEVGSQCLQYAVKCLQNGYDNFFRKCKQKVKGKKGFPQFKKRHGKQSFRIPQSVKLMEDKLVIPKFLEGIPLVLHRKLEGEIQFATISKNKAGQYHVSITVERDMQPLPESAEVIGIDLNVKDIVDSNGNKILNPRPNFQHKDRVKLLAQRVSRKKLGSKNRGKAKLALNKKKQYIHNVREDFLHKVSKRIINENQVICVEDLSVENMVKKVNTEDMPRWKQKKLHRDVLDCGFFSFVNKLMYKALWYGRELVKVSRWFPSSQLCNKCGWQYKDLPKGCKEWGCWNCFEMNDRDINSAENVLEEGLRIRTCGIQGLAYCPDVRPAKSGLLVE